MHFIHGIPVCPPLCPPLVHGDLVSSSEENLHHHRSNFLTNQKLSTYAKQFSRHFIFPFSRKENFDNETAFDEEFDEISLSDNYFNSHGKPEISHDERTDKRQSSMLVGADGLPITKRILPGITNITNNQNNTITDDGMGKTTNGSINNGNQLNVIHYSMNS